MWSFQLYYLVCNLLRLNHAPQPEPPNLGVFLRFHNLFYFHMKFVDKTFSFSFPCSHQQNFWFSVNPRGVVLKKYNLFVQISNCLVGCHVNSAGEGNCHPLQYSCLKNPMDRGTWWATVQRVAKSWTRLSN